MKTKRTGFSRVSYWVTAVIVVILALYIAIPVVRQVQSEYETETVNYITVTESGTTTGCIVRSEELLTSDRPHISYMIDNGEHISAGGTVALATQDQSDLDLAARAAEVETEITYVRSLLASLSNAADQTETESAIRATVARLSSAAAQTDAAGLDNAAVTLSSLLRGGEGSVTQKDLDDLQTELNDLRSAINTGNIVAAPAAGIFTSDADGWEGLKPDDLNGIEPEGVIALRDQNVQVGSNVIGKLVTDATWYYAAVMSQQDAARLKVGGETSLDFGYRNSSSVRAVVQSISQPTAKGEVAVVFRCTSALAETLSLRESEAEVVFQTYSGLKVPKRAVHVEGGKTVVYAVSAGVMELKTVEILYEGEDFYLVAAENEGGSLRAENEVIISGRNLGDGNVVN